MMTDLSVDYQLLEDTSKSLTSIKSEFEGIRNHESDLHRVWGSGDVSGAMDDFAGNWDYHRHKIISSIGTIGTMVDQTIQTFQKADKQLKSSLTTPAKK